MLESNQTKFLLFGLIIIFSSCSTQYITKESAAAAYGCSVCVCANTQLYFFFHFRHLVSIWCWQHYFFSVKQKKSWFVSELNSSQLFPLLFFSDSIAYILLLLLWSLWIYNYSMHILIQHGHIIIHRTRELFPWLFRHSFNGKKKNSPFSLLLFFVKQKNQKFFTLFKWWCESLFYRIFHHSIFLASNFHFISFFFFVIQRAMKYGCPGKKKISIIIITIMMMMMMICFQNCNSFFLLFFLLHLKHDVMFFLSTK